MTRFINQNMLNITGCYTTLLVDLDINRRPTSLSKLSPLKYTIEGVISLSALTPSHLSLNPMRLLGWYPIYHLKFLRFKILAWIQSE